MTTGVDKWQALRRKARNRTEEYEPYVQFKATIEKREVKDGDDLAILSISGTDSHHVLFLDSYNNIREIEKELKDADAKINHTTLKIIGGHL